MTLLEVFRFKEAKADRFFVILHRKMEIRCEKRYTYM